MVIDSSSYLLFFQRRKKYIKKEESFFSSSLPLTYDCSMVIQFDYRAIHKIFFR